MGEIGSLHVRGLVINAPGKTIMALGRLREALSQVPGVVRVVVEPPSLEDRGPSDQFGVGTESLRFVVTTRLVPAGNELAYRSHVSSRPGNSNIGDEPLPGADE